MQESQISRGDATSLLGKSLPANTDAEKSVLGAILLDDQTFSSVSEIIGPIDFYHRPHKSIFEAMASLSGDLKRIDLVSLQDELVKRNQLVDVGGTAYLISLQEDLPAVGLAQQHARIVKEKAVLRELITSAASIITNCYAQRDEDISSVLDAAESTIFEIANKRTARSFVQLDIWLKKTFQHLNDVKSHSRGIIGLPTGFGKLDEMTSGLQRGDLVIIASRPSMGKTSFALNVAGNIAAQGFGVGVFSLEMPAEQLTLRLLSTESGIAHHKIRNATISSQEWVDLTQVAGRLFDFKLFIDDTAGLSIVDVRAKARRLKAEHNIDVLIVDYLQLLYSPKRHENRHQEVSEISRVLKALAKELDIPILALSQLSRAVDSRIDKRPMMSDLRESGAIEQDADVIMFLYRDVVYNQETENPALAELIISKQRNGPTGTIFLHFERELTKFMDSGAEYS